MEIRFRAWDPTQQQMYSWEQLRIEQGLVVTSDGKRHYIDGVTDLVLMQYVGQQDRSAKELYVGDIVKTELGGVGEVVWAHGHAGFYIKLHNEGKTILTNNWRHLTKLGNVYENSELSVGNIN